jgi:ornithine--oxo-acid transaminase
LKKFGSSIPRTNAAWHEFELKHTANNYGTLPICIERSQGLYSWDIEGKKYIDLLQGISACN